MTIIPIAQPPWTQVGKRLESQIRKAMYEHQLLEKGSKVAIALSGGKDSLTLLFFLHALSGRGFPELDLIAIHVSGDLSCGSSVSTSYLEKICEKLNIKFIVKEQKNIKETTSCYPCSRERRKLLFNTAIEEGYTTIAFGHHEDDSNQTLLMNLLHKGEFSANLPKVHMQNYGITIIRPLIYVKETDIINFAQMNQFLRVTCRCPIGQNSMRKKADHILRYLEKQFPNTRNNLAQAGRLYGSKKALTP